MPPAALSSHREEQKHRFPHELGRNVSRETCRTAKLAAILRWRRFWRGLVCSLSFLVLPIGLSAAGDGSGGWKRNASIQGWC